MPMDKVSKRPLTCSRSASNTALHCKNRARWASKPSAGSGMHIRPRSCKPGNPATAAASAGNAAGATPDLLGPPSTLT
jgi:hypothetical protein